MIKSRLSFFGFVISALFVSGVVSVKMIKTEQNIKPITEGVHFTDTGKVLDLDEDGLQVYFSYNCRACLKVIEDWVSHPKLKLVHTTKFDEGGYSKLDAALSELEDGKKVRLELLRKTANKLIFKGVRLPVLKSVLSKHGYRYDDIVNSLNSEKAATKSAVVGLVENALGTKEALTVLVGPKYITSLSLADGDPERLSQIIQAALDSYTSP